MVMSIYIYIYYPPKVFLQRGLNSMLIIQSKALATSYNNEHLQSDMAYSTVLDLLFDILEFTRFELICV